MVAIQRILCPTDFSPFSQGALGLALALARQYGAALTALHVAPHPDAGEGDALLEFLEPAHDLAVVVEGKVSGGDPVDCIVERAQDWPADLLVMGTHGQREGRGWDLGSVTERVLRRAPCPVLIVAQPAESRQAVPAAPFRNVLCPSDFSEVSDRALEYALSLAQESHGRMMQLHVLEWFPEQGEHADAPEYRLDLSEAARERLRMAVPEQSRAWCQREELVATGRPHREILRVARERGADLIVLGVHGQRTLDRSLAGATVCHVVRETRCPVLAVRGTGSAREESEALAWW
jgi:nucleotide-binding universal stress UspA family protein